MMEEEIKAFIAKLLKESASVVSVPKNEIMAFIKFIDKEVLKMHKEFRTQFKENDAVAHIKKYLKKEVVYYEIKYRSNGYNISITNRNLKKAKSLFIRETKKSS